MRHKTETKSLPPIERRHQLMLMDTPKWSSSCTLSQILARSNFK